MAQGQMRTQDKQIRIDSPFDSSPAIRKRALELTRNCKSDLEKARALAKACRVRNDPFDTWGELHIYYVPGLGIARPNGTKTAREVYFGVAGNAFLGRKIGYLRTADCDEVACLFIVMAREAGLKANLLASHRAGSGLQHACAVVFIDGKKYFVDPVTHAFAREDDKLVCPFTRTLYASFELWSDKEYSTYVLSEKSDHLLRAGKFWLAEATFKKRLQIDGSDSTAYGKLFRIYAAQGRWQEAQALYKKAKTECAASNRWEVDDEFKSAAELNTTLIGAKQGIEKNSKDAGSWVRLGDAYMLVYHETYAIGFWGSALKAYETAAKIDPSNNAYRNALDKLIREQPASSKKGQRH